VGLCYAELSTLLPVQGSTYTYTYATLGRARRWMIGWDLILEYPWAAAPSPCGWSAYFDSLLLQSGMACRPSLVGDRRADRAGDGSAGTAIATCRRRSS
jgi:APA family basic amino acid/polyamine antiporter